MLPEGLTGQPLAEAVASFDAGAVTGGTWALGELMLEIDPARVVAVLGHLKSALGFERLCSVTAVDWHPNEPRFEVVYHLHSIRNNQRLRLKCRLGGEAPAIASACGVYSGADWYEREVFDLFGIAFTGHPDLRRIMMPDYWEGHPLRKDFPVHGHKYSYRDA
jgi:NADH-quinone oxidoreductase subunit C